MRTALAMISFAPPFLHGLADLFAGQRLQLFRLAADQQNRLRVPDVAMRREWPAEIFEERLQRESIRGGVVVSADQLGRKLMQARTSASFVKRGLPTTPIEFRP